MLGGWPSVSDASGASATLGCTVTRIASDDAVENGIHGITGVREACHTGLAGRLPRNLRSSVAPADWKVIVCGIAQHGHYTNLLK